MHGRVDRRIEMARFRVQLRRDAVESASVEIDAGSEQEVRDLLQSQINPEDLKWRRGSTGEEEIVGIWRQDEQGRPSDF